MTLTNETRTPAPPLPLCTYLAYGLLIGSEVELTSFPTASEPGAAPDVRIRRGSVAPALENPVMSAGYFQTAAREFLLDIPSAARYLACNGNTIVVDAYPGVDPERVRLFLMGSALGGLLYQRGLLLLHGSALDTPWGAMVFIGAQGEGKSTLAAHLHRRGYPLLSDDVCAVMRDENGIHRVIPAVPLMRLCEDALAHLEGFATHTQATTFDVDKYVVSLRQNLRHAPRALGGIHLLSSHELPEIGVRPLRGFDRMNLLMANLYRAEYLRGMESAGAVMQLAAQVVAETPFAEVRRPRDIERMDEVLDHLESYWQAMPVIESEQSS